jgi:hypothetical protein
MSRSHKRATLRNDFLRCGMLCLGKSTVFLSRWTVREFVVAVTLKYKQYFLCVLITFQYSNARYFTSDNEPDEIKNATHNTYGT